MTHVSHESTTFTDPIADAIRRADLLTVMELVGSKNVSEALPGDHTPLSLAVQAWHASSDLDKQQYKGIVIYLLRLNPQTLGVDIITQDPVLRGLINSLRTTTVGAATATASIDKSSTLAEPQLHDILSPSHDTELLDDAASASQDTSKKRKAEKSPGTSSDSDAHEVAVLKSRGVRFIVPHVLSFSDASTIELSFREIHVDTVTRPSTSLSGGAQGDHTTAYIAVMEMLMSAIAGERVTDALVRACELAKCFLAQNDYKKLTAIHNSLTGQLAEHVIDRPTRKGITKAIRAIESNIDALPPGIKPHLAPLLSSREKIKGVIKEQESLLLLEAISKIGEVIIGSHQKDPLSVLAKRRTEDVEIRPGAEGQRVKDAMLYLKLFNVLLELKSKMQEPASAANKQELLEDYKERLVDIIKASKPTIKNPGKIDENVNKFFEKLALSSATNSASTATSSRATGLSGITEAWLLQLNVESSGTLSAVGNLLNDLFDFRAPVDNKRYDYDLKNDLPKIVAKHVICLFNAFKILNNFDEGQKRMVVNEFVRIVTQPILQGGQGWVRGITQDPQTGMLSLTEDALQFMQFQRGGCAYSGDPTAEILAQPNDDEPGTRLTL